MVLDSNTDCDMGTAIAADSAIFFYRFFDKGAQKFDFRNGKLLKGIKEFPLFTNKTTGKRMNVSISIDTSDTAK
jgi:hypothetical protein